MGDRSRWINVPFQPRIDSLWTVLRHVLHGSLEGSSRSKPQLSTEGTSSKMHPCVGFPSLVISFSPLPHSVPGIDLPLGLCFSPAPRFEMSLKGKFVGALTGRVLTCSFCPLGCSPLCLSSYFSLSGKGLSLLHCPPTQPSVLSANASSSMKPAWCLQPPPVLCAHAVRGR